MTDPMSSAGAMLARAPGLLNSPSMPKIKPGEDNHEAIREAARQFESVFLHQVFKTMRSTVPKEGLMGGGFGGEVFTDMLDQQYADIASKNESLGLSETIARQLGVPEDKLNVRPENVGIRRLGAAKAYGAQQTEKINWTRPVEGQISSPFGPRRLPRETSARLHRGVDITAAQGSPIRAARSGKVAFAGVQGEYGNTVIIDHGGRTQSLYAHASELLVEPGQQVEAGAVIAKVGSTGQSAGPHLHFEVREGGRSVDPAPLLKLER